MPKEVIRSDQYNFVPAPEGEVAFPHDCRLGQVVVGWTKEVGHVELGSVDETLRQHFFSPLRDAVMTADDQGKVSGAAVTEAMIQMTKAWPEFGVFTTLDRAGINKLIRSLRRARDDAFGKDA